MLVEAYYRQDNVKLKKYAKFGFRQKYYPLYLYPALLMIS